MSPKIVPPLSQGVPSPHQTHGSLCPPRESTSQTAARSVQPCWHSSRLRPTDTQTRRPRNVVNNTSHLITPAMRPNNTVTPRRDDKPPPPPPPIAAADLRPYADGSAVGTALVACAAPVAQLARLGQLRQTDGRIAAFSYAGGGLMTTRQARRRRRKLTGAVRSDRAGLLTRDTATETQRDSLS